MQKDRQSRISAFLSSLDRPSTRSSSILTRSSSRSSVGSDHIFPQEGTRPPVILGICAMDIKARSKPMREILTRLVEISLGAIEVKVFGENVILDEDVENWPRCDVLISFFSTDFPLDKAISYVKLQNPFCINDLPPQALLWDRRLVGVILDHIQVPTPKRLEVSRDGGPQVDPELKKLIKEKLGAELGGFRVTPEVTMRKDGDAIIIDGKILEKPFVEKPVSGEDHNIYIYFRGGGGRRLFRKVGNKSSDLDPTLNNPRTDGSYIYEEFIEVDKSEDIKVYTVGKDYFHAETRKSPVVDDKAAEILASLCIRVSSSLDRPVPGADSISQRSASWRLKANVTVFRHADRTPKQKLKFNFPIGDVWTQPFVRLLNGEKEEIILREKEQLSLVAQAVEEAKALGANGEDLANLIQLNNALVSKIDLPGTKAQLKPVYSKRQAGQARKFTMLILVFKWGGEVVLHVLLRASFTHSAKYQSRDLGENIKKDLSIMNKDALQNIKIYTSSERRVIATAETFAEALVDHQANYFASPSATPVSSRSSQEGNSSNPSLHPKSGTGPHGTPPALIIRKDLLDDSNAAKDLMDDVKKRLKILLRPGEPEKRPELTWPKSMKKEPVEVVKASANLCQGLASPQLFHDLQEVIELLGSFRAIMRKNFETMDVNKIQERWCCGDNPWLFRERWEKLFEDFCDVEQKKFDPSRAAYLQGLKQAVKLNDPVWVATNG
ncbi:hypothetical protein PAXINDRAFT_182519 [Paxillus involutus ATCC 200175]|uniref:Inositol hexakisphosphate and diphosphoinositol-pentakisphosphate kinase n=1 Tax=Paxillus involutus ATCC 200175 TaxID=664439 RepID=A0A0C9TGZ9_PAXIN|nr:hypothetical protein PAXINDRAFT_182519 [Paxillus involutus ATCC 200175]